MSRAATFRDVLIVRQVRALRRSLAALASVTRQDDDPHAVRIRISTPDGEEVFSSLCLGLIPLTELVDAVRARATDIGREQRPEQPAAPVAPVLRMVHPTDSLPTATETELRNR
jgi:hypothetical protein